MDEVKAGTSTPAANGVPNNSDKTVKTIKYRVEVDCYWEAILWREGREVELPSNVTPPKEYFTKL